MDQQRQQGRARHDTAGAAADRAQDAADDRIEHAGIGDNSEKQNRKDEHARHRRDVGDTGNDEFRSGKSEAANQRGSNRDGDQGHQR